MASTTQKQPTAGPFLGWGEGAFSSVLISRDDTAILGSFGVASGHRESESPQSRIAIRGAGIAVSRGSGDNKTLD
jgi:hypothetical protein